MRFVTIWNYQIIASKVEFGESPMKLYHMLSEKFVIKTRKNLGPETLTNVTGQEKVVFITLRTVCPNDKLLPSFVFNI
jgi:hypothetical protein